MKTAVVTGGTKGIGRAIVEKFVKEEFEVITCARSAEDLKAVESELGCKTMPADLSKKEEVDKFANFINNNCDAVDVLVNNTGVFFPGTVHEEEEGTLEKMIDTNLYSAYNLTRALLPAMIERKSGSIFNLCSTASTMAYPNGGSYSISKFALYGMSKALRAKLQGKGIKVTAVLPGAVLTPSWEGAGIPEERFIPASDIAESIWSVYCLSDRTDVEEILIRPQMGDV